MKKFYKIILLLIALIFLSTFNPKEFNLATKKSDTLFKIENIEIKNNFLTNLISFKKDMDLNNLPGIFGERAENNFMIFLNQLEKNNFPNKQIKNFYYFQIGRWDLQLLNNKIIKFPHNNIEDAIIKSIELLDHKNFKSYNIIDLRIDGKIIVR